MQIADNPGRNEPGTGEINYAFLFELLDRIGYAGWIGCEYKPAAGTEAGLGWMAAPGVAAFRTTGSTDDSQPEIGFIGLGIMGKPMALNLIKGGHTLFLHSPQRRAAGARPPPAARPARARKEVAQKADVIITMVPDTPDVEKVLFGARRRRRGPDARARSSST